MPVIEANNLEFQYPSGRGIKEISLRVDQGECLGLLGRNGSGKTTLTRIIMGLEKPYSGRLKVFGSDGGKGSGKYLHRIGCALDSSAHWENLSGWKNALFFARAYHMTSGHIEESLQELFELSGLGDRARDPVRDYSYGMRRKLALIQAVCHDPELLVLDEPTAGVDAHFLNRLARIIGRRSKRGLTTWIAGNNPDWISGLTTRLAFMDSGRIQALGTEEDFLSELSSFQRVSLRLDRYLEMGPLPDARVRSFEQSGRDITLILKKDPQLIPVIVNWIIARGGEMTDLHIHRGTLRDAFLMKTGQGLGGDDQ